MPGLIFRQSRAPRTARSGFTLLEVIVATAIMAMAVVALLSLLSSTLANAARIRQYDRVAMLARTKMNELMLLSPMPIGQTLSGQFDPATGWTASVTLFERLPNATPGMDQLARIDLNIWWMADGVRKSASFETLRRDLIRPGAAP